AQDAGLEIGETGAIKVNEYLQTSDPSIYAGGDCVENPHLITGKPVYVPLGSTANKHGRVLGDNVTGGSTRFEGVLGTVVFKAFDFNVGRVGLSETECARLGIPCVTALTPGPDRAHYYPTSKPMILKMVAHSKTGKLLGIQAVGRGEVVKRIDVAATAITFGIDARNVSGLDLGYAPPYSSAVDIIQHAANVIDNKLSGLAKSCSPAEVKSRLDAGNDFVLLDVRTPAEVQSEPFPDARVVHIPLGKLRERAGELPRDKEIVVFCKTSFRAWEAQRILEGLGFARVQFVDGGLAAWPYPRPKAADTQKAPA
ncbi:MAG: rhodanese-like domain-containing protein, partial [Armatimonadota bacterium]